MIPVIANSPILSSVPFDGKAGLVPWIKKPGTNI
jgi:hypothetical protein